MLAGFAHFPNFNLRTVSRDPSHAKRGVNHFALEKMKESGMKLAIVATGGDPGHAPARRTYEKAGYTSDHNPLETLALSERSWESLAGVSASSNGVYTFTLRSGASNT